MSAAAENSAASNNGAAEAQPKLSRVGKRPVPIPKGVTVKLNGPTAEVKGPKGQLFLTMPEHTSVSQEADALLVASSAAGSNAARLQGLGRALLVNVIKGCAEGFERTLELVGTGYRAELRGRDLHLSLGLSHPVVFPLPEGVNANIPGDSKGTIINLSSADKAAIGQAAATIRSYRPPEPYAGKGVRYKDEHVRRKAGKAGKK